MAKPKIRFNGYTEDWEQRKVSELCSISTGKSNTQDKVEDGEYPFYVRSPIIERSTKYLYDEEAVITVGDGVGTGKVFHYVNGKYDLHQRCYRMYGFSDELNAHYFYHTFSKLFYKRVMAMTAKTSVDSVRLEMISDMKIPVPNVEEQRKIGNLLDGIDHLITLHQRKCEQTKTLKKYMLQKMFPQDGEKVPQIRFEGFTEDWEQRKLEELGSLKNGMNFSKEAMGIGFPFVNLQNIFGNNVIDVTNLGKAMASDSQLKDYNLLNGDVLFVRSSVKLEGVGEAALVPQNLENTTYSGFIIRFRDEYGLDNNFKRFLFGIEFVRNQIMAQATNSANKNISQTVLENLCLKIPKKSEQEKIGLYFSNLDHLITLHQRKCDELKEVKKFMLQNMFV